MISEEMVEEGDQLSRWRPRIQTLCLSPLHQRLNFAPQLNVVMGQEQSPAYLPFRLFPLRLTLGLHRSVWNTRGRVQDHQPAAADLFEYVRGECHDGCGLAVFQFASNFLETYDPGDVFIDANLWVLYRH
jgi:hypothetical protein